MSGNISPENRGRAFGRAVAEALAVRGLKQIDIATALNTTQSTVSAWINARAEPDADTVFALEGVLDMAPGVLSRNLNYLPLSAVDAPPDVEDAIARSPKLDEDGRKLTLITYRTMAAMYGRSISVVADDGVTTRTSKRTGSGKATAAANNAVAAKAKTTADRKDAAKPVAKAATSARFQRARQPRS